jgi:AraC-like DNA-binding protein
MDLSSVVSLVGTSFGLLAILIAILKKKGDFFKKASFLVMLICLTYYCFMVFIVDSGKILQYPHLFRTGSPFFYLLAIAILWVGQAYLFDKKKLEKSDFLLLLIPILHLIENTPFYLQSTAQKSAYLQSLLVDRDQILYANEGWLPTSIHYGLQLIFGLLVSGYLIYCTHQEKTKKDSSNAEISWLKALAYVFLTFYILGISLLIFDSQTLQIHSIASWLFGIMLVVQLFFLFFRPEVLYDIKESKKEENITVSIISLEEDEVNKYQQVIEDYFRTNDDFLNTDFRQQHLASHLNIPKNRLSQIINQVFDKNFNQLINEKRIEVAIERLESKAWRNLTVEGVAQMVGFKSRTTFNKAFQEKTGVTPSQFRKQMTKT